MLIKMPLDHPFAKGDFTIFSFSSRGLGGISRNFGQQ